MAASAIAVAFTPPGGSTYNFVFRQFTGTTIARSHADGANFDVTVTGTTTLTGPSYRSKRLWAISTIISRTDAASFEQMYRDWDLARSTGQAVALGLTDETFGSTISTSVTFSTAPTFDMRSYNQIILAFGVTEV